VGNESPGDVSATGEVVVEDVDGVRYVTISNGARRNALTRAMVKTVGEAVAEFSDDDSTRVLVISGAGHQAFSAGADLKEMAALQAEGHTFEPVMPALFQALLELEKPVIAALNGDAVGGGFELSLCCDLRIARAGIRVGLPEVTLAMIPRYGTVLASRLASSGVALELALTGQLMTAEAARDRHLVTTIVPTEEFESEVRRLASMLASYSAAALLGIKFLANTSASASIQEVVSSPRATATLGSSERVDAVAAFDR
jgi:enoyl-CoA hydratase/carnithine racemase